MFTAEFIQDVTTKMNSGEYGTLDLFKLFLDRKAEVDEDFRPMYAKENKSLENCWKYITLETKKAYEEQKNNTKCFATNVFKLLDLAFHYYCEDSIDEELKEKEMPKVQVASQPIAPPAPKIQEKVSKDKKFVQHSLFEV